jgi:hypothetical protein
MTDRGSLLFVLRSVFQPGWGVVRGPAIGLKAVELLRNHWAGFGWGDVQGASPDWIRAIALPLWFAALLPLPAGLWLLRSFRRKLGRGFSPILRDTASETAPPASG